MQCTNKHTITALSLYLQNEGLSSQNFCPLYCTIFKTCFETFNDCFNLPLKDSDFITFFIDSLLMIIFLSHQLVL